MLSIIAIKHPIEYSMAVEVVLMAKPCGKLCEVMYSVAGYYGTDKHEMATRDR